jgi:hypothetical protein
VLKTPSSVVLGAAAPVVSKTAAAPPSGATLVLKVSTSVTPQLMLTVDAGHLWVALRPPNAANPPSGVTTVRNVLAQAAITSTSTTTKTGKHP